MDEADVETARRRVNFSDIEQRLLELSAQLDRPIDGMPSESVLVLGLARQAIGVYRGVLREADADGVTAATILVRAIAEAVILVRWIELDPGLHAAMYQAEDHRQSLAAAGGMEKFKRRQSQPVGDPVFSPEVVAEKNAEMRRVRALAQKASEPIGDKGALLPQVQQMAERTKDPDIQTAYDVLYRFTSASTHFGGRSLTGHRFERRSDDSVYLVVKPHTDSETTKTIAASLVAVLISSASRVCGFGIETEADAILADLAAAASAN
jgi:hypothetical protein